VAFGKALRSSIAAPATYGAAIDVPVNSRIAGEAVIMPYAIHRWKVVVSSRPTRKLTSLQMPHNTTVTDLLHTLDVA
jgi:hypothetical protein